MTLTPTAELFPAIILFLASQHCRCNKSAILYLLVGGKRARLAWVRNGLVRPSGGSEHDFGPFLSVLASTAISFDSCRLPCAYHAMILAYANKSCDPFVLRIP